MTSDAKMLELMYWVKSLARRLRATLDMRLSHAYESLAVDLGFNTWSAAHAAVERCPRLTPEQAAALDDLDEFADRLAAVKPHLYAGH